MIKLVDSRKPFNRVFLYRREKKNDNILLRGDEKIVSGHSTISEEEEPTQLFKALFVCHITLERSCWWFKQPTNDPF